MGSSAIKKYYRSIIVFLVLLGIIQGYFDFAKSTIKTSVLIDHISKSQNISITKSEIHETRNVSQFYPASFFDPALISNILFSREDNGQADTLKSLNSDDYMKFMERDLLKGGRTSRWYYGWVIFRDYPWYKKLFGGGFDFLVLYGQKFATGKYDWPHNPFISAFLYSGIIGGIAFIIFIMLAVYNYIRFLRRHLFFFVSFIITFFFVFFSDTSLFNTPLFTILCIIPFYTKYLFLKESCTDSGEITFRMVLIG